MINGVNNYTNWFNNNTQSSSLSEVEQVIEDYNKTKTNTENEVKKTQYNENLSLSSKAQKINAISVEFFGNGGPSLNDLEQLKERIYQLGLISSQEYSALTNTSFVDDETSTSNENSTQGVANYIGDFIERLNDGDDSEDKSDTILALTEVLTTAKNIISDTDTAKSDAEFKDTLTSSMAFLKETINAPEFGSLPISDQVNLSKVYQTLEIVDKISPTRLTNDKLNQYMKFSF